MTAAQRIAALDELPAGELIASTQTTLSALVVIINEETTLLRAGHHREAGRLVAEKTRLAQDYVSLSRAVQRQLERLTAEAPDSVFMLRTGHDKFATQLAENLKVIATARNVTEDLLTDVAERVARAQRPRTYGATGEIADAAIPAGGIAINRAL